MLGAFGKISYRNIEIKKILLETGGKAILVIKWVRIWLNCVLMLVEGRTCKQ